MRLSPLQRNILTEIYLSKAKKYRRKGVRRLYRGRAQADEVSKVMTKSLERLIDNELMTGYGRRTPHKWFISEVQLTTKGRRTAKELLGKQQALPFGRRGG
ncbi:MAG: hypothetical protein Q8Q20_01965 [bacterium]|nr:hypothetical protein [bacterium]